ncbi:hypothetical protein BJ165DRAFT_1568693 [Panaeolus papilionaceus]|nr:hypothetical protein BJ165DRAFT_1568693 [Panaeolus papilionaceus]
MFRMHQPGTPLPSLSYLWYHSASLNLKYNPHQNTSNNDAISQIAEIASEVGSLALVRMMSGVVEGEVVGMNGEETGNSKDDGLEELKGRNDAPALLTMDVDENENESVVWVEGEGERTLQENWWRVWVLRFVRSESPGWVLEKERRGEGREGDVGGYKGGKCGGGRRCWRDCVPG